MKTILGFVSLVILATILTANLHDSTNAQKTKPAEIRDAGKPIMLTLDDMKWTALSERPGMQFSVLSGDPKTTEYTQMRKVPAGTDNPLHSHTSEIKNVIISGVWYTGADAASAKDFGPGSIIVMPGNWVHVSGCRAGTDCLFYQEGKGKFDFKPSDAKPSEMKPE